ncbi:MAG TPA: hypothetical protein ENF33_06090 [Nitrososphaeria archaeon]|nr:hypothetical protein [Nitrososphaeria archaeon]
MVTVEPPTYPIEGFYVKVDEMIMAVKGVLQPPGKVIALPTHLMLDGGFKRIRSLEASLSYFIERYPEYYDWFNFAGRKLPAPPLDVIDRIYSPLSMKHVEHISPEAERLRKILVKESGVDESFIGITGSILLKTYSPKSDIDLVIYGIENGRRVYESVNELRRSGVLQCLKDDYELRKSRVDSSLQLNTWILVERSKILTGTFSGKVYTAKIVPLPSEYWESLDQECIEIGAANFIGEVIDDKYSILTPNKYLVLVKRRLFGEVREGEVVEVFSMRSRFAEMASHGDLVKVTGRLELVKLHGKEWKRVFLGNCEKDVIISLHYI